jgi:hypothetical protein
MADQLIQEIISEQAFKDVERLQELMAGTIKQFEDGASSVKEFDAALRSAKSIPELNKAIADNLKLEKEMIRQEQELEKLNKQKIITEKTIEQLKQSQIKTDSDTIKLQNLKNKESEKATKLAADEADAYKRLSKEYKDAAAEAKRLSVELGFNNEVAVKASEKAKALHDQLFAVEKRVGQFGREVANYGGSAKIIVDALERQKQKVVQVGRSFGEMSPEAAAARHEMESLQRITDNPQFLNIASKVGDTNKELRFFTQRLNELEDAGLKNSAVYQDVRGRLAQLTDQIGDTKAEVKALASDTRGFDLFAGSVKTLAAAWQTAAGAAELFGGQNEDVQKSIQRLVAIQSVANGVQQLATEFTTRGTAANKVFAFTQGLLTKAFDSSATAATRFKAALGILGLIATVIGAVVLAYNYFSKSTQEVITRQKVLNDITRDAADNYGKEKVQLDTLVGVIQKEGATRKQKFEALKELQKNYPGYFDNLKTEKDLNNDLAEAYKNASEGILQKARAQAAADRISKNEAEKITLEIQFQEDSLQFEKDLTKRRLGLREQDREQFFKDIGPEVRLRRTEFEKKKAEIDAENKFLLSLVVDQKKKELEVRKPDNKAEDAARKAEFEILRIGLQNRIDFQNKISENERQSIATRARAIISFLEYSKQLIEAEADFEKEKKGVTAKEVEAIEAAKHDKLIRLAEQGADRLRALQEKEIEEQQKLRKKLNEKGDITLPTEMNSEFKRMLEERSKLLDEYADHEKRLVQEKRSLYKTLYSEVANAIQAIIEGPFEREKNKLQEQSDTIDKQKEKQISEVETTVTNEQEKANRIAVINNKAQAQKETIEARQRDVDVKKAKFDRIFRAFQITTSTIESVAKIKASVAELTARAAINPFLAALIPVAAAQIPITIAIGAAQLATLLATPLPKYGKGRRGGKAEWALTGESGTEVIEQPDGRKYLVDRPTVTFLHENAKVIPNHELNDQAIRAAALSSMHVFPGGHVVDTSFNGIELALQRHTDRIVKAYANNKTTVHVINDWKGSEVKIEKMNSWIKWVNDNVTS